jgi:UDP-4-amino-4,6-dideoxy-N-acetyl-beta-L-altrosamine transaminase
MPPRFLPYGHQSIDDDDIAAVAEVLRGPALTGGAAVIAFEAALAEVASAHHAVVCANGTAALHLACLVLGLGPGDAVVVPAVTFTATANAARMVGAEVEIADVDPETALMRPADLARSLERIRHRGLRPRLVMVVHMAGQSPDLRSLAALARDAGCSVVEDACHALGALHADGPVGDCAHSDMTVFSFHPVKTVAAGEGGAVTTNDPVLADRLRKLRNHDIRRHPEALAYPDQGYGSDGLPNPWYYEVSELGFNYRLSDIHCALGLSQLRKLEVFVARRSELTELYDRLLAPLAPRVRPLGRSPFGRPAWHLQVVRLAPEVHRADLMRRLQAVGIGTQVHYVPLHHHPFHRRGPDALPLPGADAYYAGCLSLPLFPAMENEDVERVVAALRANLEPAS